MEQKKKDVLKNKLKGLGTKISNIPSDAYQNFKGLVKKVYYDNKAYDWNKKADLFKAAKEAEGYPEYRNPDGILSNYRELRGEVTEPYKTRVVAGEEMRRMRKKKGLPERSSNPSSLTNVY